MSYGYRESTEFGVYHLERVEYYDLTTIIAIMVLIVIIGVIGTEIWQRRYARTR